MSHREPAPSDRDPIPPPFDNAYNARERDYFHYKVKYHRDDRFLVEHILDDATRNRLDIAWNDLLGSFEYHDICLRFVADKYKLDLDGRDITQVDSHWIEELPAEPREYVRNLRVGYQSVQRALKAAQSGHVADVIRLASHAWRRPLDGSEQERLRVFYDGLKDNSHLDHAEAIRVLIARILVAPNFLFRAERPPNRSGVAALSDWELASRLSYFLWSSLPDAELRRAAESGELSDPQLLEGQARRMLRDPKARRMATEFFGQWFGFYQFDRYGGVDPRRFPEFTDRLRAAMHDEAIEFFTHIVQNDRPVSEILLADYAFLNDDLAQHYGIDAEFTTTTERLERVEGVNRFHRGGLLGLGAVLTVTSAPLRTSPVKRGDWILRRVMGTPVPPPPPDAGSIPADDVLEDGKTLRERLVAHRRQPSCANCHARIDPLGFSLENYDALGRWRDRYRDGKAIDASGTLSDGTDVSGPNGLRRHLANQERLFRQTLCTKLVGYALGRGVLVSDTDLIDEMMETLRRDDRFSNLIVKIVSSPQFCYHRGHDGSGREVSVEGQREGEIDEDSG